MKEPQHLKEKTMNKSQLKENFDSMSTIYEALKEEALFILKTVLSETDIKIHSILSRIKDFESFYEKIERKEILEPFEEVNDVIGLRVVCLFLSDIERIGDLIRSSFEVQSQDNKIDGNEDISSFGYMSYHFIVKMKREYKGPRYEKIREITFEIQVRTISMDAWANISHYLSYKTDADIPKELKRDFFALSGLFYVSDTHFELFFKESNRSQKNTQERVDLLLEDTNKDVKEDINLDSLRAYLKHKFPDRKHSGNKGISRIITELNKVGINNIGQIEDMYDLAWDVFLLNEKTSPPSSGGLFMDVGVIRGLLILTNEEYRTQYRREVDGKFLEMIEQKREVK